MEKVLHGTSRDLIVLIYILTEDRDRVPINIKINVDVDPAQFYIVHVVLYRICSSFLTLEARSVN